MENEQQVKADMAFAKEFNHTLHAYIDIADDLVAGTLLSQIVYWFTEDKNGKTKLRVRKDNEMWLVKTRTDWYEEVRISPKQYDRAIKMLSDKGLVETRIYRFNNQPTTHIRPIWDNLRAEIDQWKQSWIEKDAANLENITNLPKGEIGTSPKVKLEFPQRVNPLTENTTQNTTRDYKLDDSYITFFYKTEKSQSANDEFDFDIVERQIRKYCKENDSMNYLNELIDTFRYFYDDYKRCFGRNHTRLSQKNIDSACYILLSFAYNTMGDFVPYDYKVMAYHYFRTRYKRDTNYSILHFTSEGILTNLYYKHIYQDDEEVELDFC